jgi:hypothetical protein
MGLEPHRSAESGMTTRGLQTTLTPFMGRLRELESKQDGLTERLSLAPVDIPDIHPNVACIYRRKVERLATALQHPRERDAAAEAIRGLIERITLTPGPKRGEIAATLHGEFGTILDWVAQKQNTPGAFASGVSVSVVAGTRSVLNLRDPQVEGGAGGRNHLNLRPQKGRPFGADGLRDLVSKFEIIAQASNRLNLLFQVPA